MSLSNIWIEAVATLGAILFVALVLIVFMILESRRIGIRDFFASADRYLLIFGVALIIFGLTFSFPILSSAEGIFLYEKKIEHFDAKPPPEIVPADYIWQWNNNGTDINGNPNPPWVYIYDVQHFNFKFLNYLFFSVVSLIFGLICVSVFYKKRF